MSDLLQLYQEIILSHNKSPLNYGTLEDHTGSAEVNNPLCGDQVTVFWKSEGDILSEITFIAQGCAISRASASMMTHLLKGKSIPEAREFYANLVSLLRGEDSGTTMDEQMGDLVALSGVRKYPARIKCATLAWHALIDNIAGTSGSRS